MSVSGQSNSDLSNPDPYKATPNDPVDAPMPPSGAPMGESVLKEDIFYNGHIIPEGSTFRIG